MLQITDLKYIKGYTIWLQFNDGTEGTVDLGNHLKGPVFEPLKEINFFKQAYLNQETDTISWPNGVDLAPEFLKQYIS